MADAHGWHAAYLGSGDWAILDDQAAELFREADVKRFIRAEGALDAYRQLLDVAATAQSILVEEDRFEDRSTVDALTGAIKEALALDPEGDR